MSSSFIIVFNKLSQDRVYGGEHNILQFFAIKLLTQVPGYIINSSDKFCCWCFRRFPQRVLRISQGDMCVYRLVFVRPAGSSNDGNSFIMSMSKLINTLQTVNCWENEQCFKYQLVNFNLDINCMWKQENPWFSGNLLKKSHSRFLSMPFPTPRDHSAVHDQGLHLHIRNGITLNKEAF